MKGPAPCSCSQAVTWDPIVTLSIPQHESGTFWLNHCYGFMINISAGHVAKMVVMRKHNYLARRGKIRQSLSFTQAPSWEQSVAFYRNLASSGYPHFVALDDEEVIGWVDVSPQFGNTRSHIGALGIGLISGARHQGVGTTLRDQLADAARRSGDLDRQVRALELELARAKANLEGQQAVAAELRAYATRGKTAD
jgi:putative acetyltransferase